MKLKKLACKNCGAKLEIEEGASQVKCNFCGTSFSVEDAYNEGYNYTKGVLKATDEHMKENLKTVGKIPMALGIIVIIMFFVIFSIISYRIINSNNISDLQDEWTKESAEIDKKYFNHQYEIYSGKKSTFFISHALDNIVTNNKTNKNYIITVSYNNITSNEESKIKEIRDMLNNNIDYDISLDYDSRGYVNKFTITDINN